MAQDLQPVDTSSKRPGDEQATSDRPSKKPRIPYHHYHDIRHEFKGGNPECEPAFIDDAQIDVLLKRAIATQCQGYGFESVEEVALDRFRSVVEEFVLNFTRLVRESMLASRRAQPMYTDFEWAFERTKVPEQYREGELPFEELQHDIRIPFKPNSPMLLPTPPPEDNAPPSLDILNSRKGALPDRKKGFIPASFPPLPAPHAYKQTAVYSHREDDPRRIREMATEEGRMGEQALRKLAGATRMETKVDLQEEMKRSGKTIGWDGKKPPSMESMFEKTMQSLMRKEMEDHPEMKARGEQVKFELGPIVNWERKYWMQPNASGRAKADSSSGVMTKGKQTLKADPMDIS